MKKLMIGLALCLFGLPTFAQGITVSLTGNQAVYDGKGTPTLTWSTNPVATSCTASGGWTGTKLASGTETLAEITSSKSYTLTCMGAGDTKATLSWSAPTTNTDGSALVDLTGYKVYFGTAPGALTNTKSITGTGVTSTVITALTGTWFFAVRSVNANGVESDNSNVASKTMVAATSGTKTFDVTVRPVPNPPGNLTVAQNVAFDVVLDESTFMAKRGKAVGSIKLGLGCDEDRCMSGNVCAISRPGQVRLYPKAQPRSQALVASCA